MGDECVLDLVGRPKGSKYHHDHTVSIFSNGKMVASILMAIARSNGWLDYDEKVVTYWPALGKTRCGKENLRVKDVLRHECWLDRFVVEGNRGSLPLEWTLTENIKKNFIGKCIENTPMYPRRTPTCNRIYHAISRDWITNEIFRRVEPRNRTMGEYFQQEIEQKLGISVYPKMEKGDLENCWRLTNADDIFFEALWTVPQSCYAIASTRFLAAIKGWDESKLTPFTFTELYHYISRQNELDAEWTRNAPEGWHFDTKWLDSSQCRD